MEAGPSTQASRHAITNEETPVPAKKSRRGNRNQPILNCMECRRMKFKCDRKVPCSNCVKRGLSAICPHGQLDPKAGRYVVNSDQILQNRVVQLEKELAAAKEEISRMSGTDSTIAPTPTPTLAQPDLPLALNSNGPIVATPSLEPPSIITMRSETPVEPNSLEGSDQDEGQLFLSEEPGGSRFFGKAAPSYLYASQDGYKSFFADAPHSPTHSVSASSAQPSHPFPELAFNPDLTLDMLVRRLPLPSVAHSLTNVYFEFGSFNNSIITQSVFIDRHLAPVYSAVRPPETNNQDVAIVCLVLAIGAQMDVRLPAHNELAETLFLLGRTALSLDPYPSVSLIQAVHLMSRYSGNSLKVPKTCPSFWSTLGGAVRSAQQLGLHRDGRRWNLAHEEAEARRRVFWEIYYEEILQCMTQGRPKMIADFTVDVQKPELKSNDRDSQFHEHKYRTFEIAAQVNDLQCRVSPTPYRTVIEIDKTLREVESRFPPMIQYQENQLEVQPNLRHAFQRLTLKTYITQSIYFLHRTHFAHALHYFPQEPLQSPYKYSFVSELEASRVLLQILRDAMTLNVERTCRIWAYWFHGFNAIVSFAATVIRSPKSSLANAILVHIEDGVELFERVPVGYTPHYDLPVLRRLLTAARQGLATHTTQDRDGKQSLEILAIGTKLLRGPPNQPSNTGIPSTPLVTSNSNITGTGTGTGIQPNLILPLPTTLEAAVATQDAGAVHETMHSDDVFISNFSMASNTRWATDVLPSAGEYEPPAGNEFDFEAFMAEFGYGDPS